MSWISKLLYSQSIFPYVVRAVEFIAGTATYAGSYLFGYLEARYIKDFDSKHRQAKPVTAETPREDGGVPDWENPEIVGRNRRNAHTVLRSFRSAEAAFSYWASGGADEEKYCKKFLLTGAAGSPPTEKEWKFLLVGCPAAAPGGWWEQVRADEGWVDVALPAHWQCQGFDIPIYTNTVYPVSTTTCSLHTVSVIVLIVAWTCSFVSTPLELAAMAPGLPTCATLALGDLHRIQPRRALTLLEKILLAYISVSFVSLRTGQLTVVDIS